MNLPETLNIWALLINDTPLLNLLNVELGDLKWGVQFENTAKLYSIFDQEANRFITKYSLHGRATCYSGDWGIKPGTSYTMVANLEVGETVNLAKSELEVFLAKEFSNALKQEFAPLVSAIKAYRADHRTPPPLQIISYI